MGNTIEIYKPKFLTESYNVTPADHTLICTASSGSIKFNLPSASGLKDKEYYFENTGAATLSVDADGSETIDGAAAVTLNTNDTLRIKSDDANWNSFNPVNSTTAGEPTGSDQVLNIVTLTQAEYDAGTPVSGTLYIITDAVSITKEFSLAVPEGSVTGYYSVNKFGRNTDVDTAIEDIWDGGGTWVAPTTARIHNIASTSASDASGGVGARTIQVYGLTSWSSAEVSETVTMSGVSNVATSNSYVIIHRMKVLTKGATNVNVGTITATAVTDATVTAQINASEGQTQMAIYGIPSTQTAFVTGYYASINKANASGALDVGLQFNPEPDTELTNFQIKHTQGLIAQGSSLFSHKFSPYNSFSGPGIFKITAIGSTNNFDVSAGFDLYLKDN